ncbi:2075_t:CDS:2, partial [Funneliformis caledonium]
MHLCKVCVISESRLSWLNKEKPLKIKIVGSQLPINVLISHNPSVLRLNLSRQVRDHIIVNRRSDHHTANSIKSKLLMPFNGAEENELKEALKNQRQICNNNKLRSYLMHDDQRLGENSEVLKLKGYILYYQQPDPLQSEEEKQFYQLTLSNEFWLRNGKKFGQNCIGMDSKHDLNNDRTPVLVLVTENNSDSGTPLAFGGLVFSPKDNISECNSDPFRPPELKHKTNKGASPKAVTKLHKPSRILQTLQSNSQNETNPF